MKLKSTLGLELIHMGRGSGTYDRDHATRTGDGDEDQESSWYNNNSNYWKAMMGRINICVGVLF